MDLNLSSQTEESYVQKRLFRLKANRSDGLLLQVQHSYAAFGEVKRSRFQHMAFNDSSTYIALSDHHGKIFIIDLGMERYWELIDVGISTFVSFPSFKKWEIMIGLNSGDINLINIETRSLVAVLSGHSVPVSDVSYSDDGRFCLTSCLAEAIIWDLQSNIQIYRLSVKEEMTLKKVLFMPVTNHIIGCFQDDAMHVWKFGSFECVKQILPESWKSHHLKSIALTKNGRAMVIGGQTPSLVVFCLDTWIVKKIIEFPNSISGVKHIEFVPQVFDGGANKILALLTNSGIYFLDVETSAFLRNMRRLEGTAAKVCVSSNGKYLAIILASGEVNIYATQKVLEGDRSQTPVEAERSGAGMKSVSEMAMPNKRHSYHKKKLVRSTEALNSVQKEIRQTITLEKLSPLLKEFGEYPETYRVLIWKTILRLPTNREAFTSLSAKECHPSYADLESQYPLVNKALLNTLKRLLSNLSHWCPLFGELGYLPEFAFPFVKLFHFDPFVCFEAVATIIVNWCQNWFEFYPFPPVNTLAMIENVLGYHDPDLLEFYFNENVTSSLYACTLLETVLSEVLSKKEWLRLWDHVVSNEPAFLLMTIVAYNVVCRNAVKNCCSRRDIDAFFHNQNAVDLKMLISKSYFFLENTPKDIHPRRYLAPFRPLSQGGAYGVYEGYPKIIVDSNIRKLRDIRKEEMEILREQRKAIVLKKELERKLKTDSRARVREEILQELDRKFRKLIDEERERIAAQRRKLQNLKSELQLKELAVLEKTRDEMFQKFSKQKKLELEQLIDDISKKRAREKSELAAVEKEIRQSYSDLLSRKHGEESDHEESAAIMQNLRLQEKELKQELMKLRNQVASLRHNKGVETGRKLSALNKVLRDVEVELAKEGSEHEIDSKNASDLIETKTLEEKFESLVNEFPAETVSSSRLQEIDSKNDRPFANPAQEHQPIIINIEDSRSKWSASSQSQSKNSPSSCEKSHVNPKNSDLLKIIKKRHNKKRTVQKRLRNESHSSKIDSDESDCARAPVRTCCRKKTDFRIAGLPDQVQDETCKACSSKTGLCKCCCLKASAETSESASGTETDGRTARSDCEFEAIKTALNIRKKLIEEAKHSFKR